MGARGPAPKSKSRRARRNADTTAETTLIFEPCNQPELPELPGGDEWSPRTKEWWRKWGDSPLADGFCEQDWEYLLDTALVHNDVWGFMNLDRLGELRIRVSEFGVTYAARARLRIQFAEADEKDAKRPKPVESARERRGDLKVVDFKKLSS